VFSEVVLNQLAFPVFSSIFRFPTLTHMCAQHKHMKLRVKHTQTLADTNDVVCFDVRSITDATAVLITGHTNGAVGIYQFPLSHTQPLKFILQHRFQCHNIIIDALHIHRSEFRLVTAGADTDVKVWDIKDVTTPRLIKCIPHPCPVWCCVYSESGLIATGCNDGTLRVYNEEPLLSLRWSVNTSGFVRSLAFSPSNRLAASFRSDTVQVWDSSFQTIFKHQQERALWGSIVFASNDLLLSSCERSHKMYCYHMSKPKVMSVFMNVFPFCRDVMNIVITYLPVVTRITHHVLPNEVGAVTSLNSTLAVSSCADNWLRIYEDDGKQSRLLGRVSLTHAEFMSACVYPFAGKETGFVIASSYFGDSQVYVTIIVPQVWIQ